MKKILNVTALILTAVFFTALFSGCSENNGIDWEEDGGKAYVEEAAKYNASGKNPVATIVIKDYGTITAELYPQKAPQTVYNFIYLANSEYYDGLTFHRIIEDFMIQGGDPEGNGTGGPGYTIKGEFSGNRFKYNDISHERGVLSMARGQAADSAGSQFFIMHAESKRLDGLYAAFGKVTSGIEVVDEIVKLPVGYNGALENASDAPVIESIRVDTFGDEYPEPVKYDASGNVIN